MTHRKALCSAVGALSLVILLVTGIPGTAGASQNEPGKGFVAYDSAFAQTTAVGTTETQVDELATTFTLPMGTGNFAHRYVELSAALRLQASGGPVTGDVYVTVTSANTGQTYVAGASSYIATPGGAGGTTAFVRGVALLPWSETWTARVWIKKTAGVGTLIASYTTNGPQNLLIEDLGR